MDSFALCPLQSAYTPSPKVSVIEQQLLGGFARQRVSFINNVHVVNADVMLNNKAKQQYFWAFWRKHTQYDPQHFLWRLMIDDIEISTYECQFDVNSLQVGERNGIVFKVSFSIRCKPAQPNVEFDQAVIAAWSSGDAVQMTNLLEKLVNQALPDAVRNL